MEKCNCYHVTAYMGYSRDTDSTYNYERAECWGTKERETCRCGGDKSKCDFYPEIREKAKKEFNTAEMWLAAQKDGETYVTDYHNTSYSKEDGFWSQKLDNFCDTPSLNDWMNAMWRKQEKRKLTKEQAEKEFGVKIVD